MTQKYIYFASDFHLGWGDKEENATREKAIVAWLDEIEDSIEALYLVGDIFDYWYEYKMTIPMGHHRFLGKIQHLKDKNIPIIIFTGNHDMWMFDYFQREMGIPVHKKPQELTIKNLKFYIGHGDGLGPADYQFKFIKKLLANPVLQWLYGCLPSSLGLSLMKYFSQKSRGSEWKTEPFGDDEWLVSHAEKILQTIDIDYFVFGHRHLPIVHKLSNGKSHYINLGDWVVHRSYAKFDGKELKLAFFKNEKGQIYG